MIQSVLNSTERHERKVLNGEDYKYIVKPFLQDESAIKALQSYINDRNEISREGMYLLNYITTLLETLNKNKQNGTTAIYQRTPAEIFGGLLSGGRKNIQASLICRSNDESGKKEQESNDTLEYSRNQEIICKWAKKDGCWSDTPDSDQKAAGLEYDADLNGHEARVYWDERKTKINKTIEFADYKTFDEFLDRITIHNSEFPYAAMVVEGFGQREDTNNKSGYVVVISQKYCHGERPTWEQIIDGMHELGYYIASDKTHFISLQDNVAICDVNGDNSVWNEEEQRLLVFDCDARLKTFKVEKIETRDIEFDSLRPDNQNSNKTWENLIGENYKKISYEQRSKIYKMLRFTKEAINPTNGHIIKMMDPTPITVELNGKKQTVFDCTKVETGPEKAFRKETTYQIPPIKYSQENVNAIKKTIEQNVAKSMWIDDFLYNKNMGGQTAQYRGGGITRDYIIKELRKKGRLEGTYNGYLISLDPDYAFGTKKSDMKILVTKPENIEMMLFAANRIDENKKLSQTDKESIINGYTINKNGEEIYFNIDKGRIDNKKYPINKQALKKQNRPD